MPASMDDRLRATVRFLSRMATYMESEENGSTEGRGTTDAEEQVAMPTEEDIEMLLALLKTSTGATEKTPHKPEIESIEPRILQLEAQAKSAEVNFERLHTVEWIEKAIECRRQVLSLTPEEHEGRWYRLATLGAALSRRADRLGEQADVNEAIELQTQALRLMQDYDSNKLALLNNLGISHRGRFEHLGEPADVDQAIQYQTQAVLLTPDDHADQPGQLSNLGNSHLRRFERLGELGDLDKAIECQTKAVLLTPDGHADKPGLLSNLGGSQLSRFERLGELADVNKAIESLAQAVLPTPDGHAAKPDGLNNLGAAHLRQFQRLGELIDVDKAIEYQTQAVLLTPDGHAAKPGRLGNLGSSHMCRFERLGELADVDKAIECQTQAALLTPDGHTEKPGFLNNLGSSHLSRFERLGELADADKAIECQTQAVLLTPEGHAHQPDGLNNLGSSHLGRFHRLGELADVDQAIQSHTQAVMLTPDGHADKPRRLNNLGNSHMCRFDHFGELADVDKAIEYQTQAILLTPNGHAEKPAYLNNLGMSHLCRFERLGELVDVNKAIEFQTQAVLLTPANHAAQPSQLSSLGTSHMSRFQHLEELADADKAIECQTQALLLIPDGHAGKPGKLSSLGSSYMYRFDRLGELADVDQAIECQTQALLLTPDGHADKPGRLTNLGISLLLRFEHLGELADLDKAIDCQTRAAALGPDGLRQKPNQLNNLGRCYMARFWRQGIPADLESAKLSYEKAAQHIITDPKTQIQSARRWAKALRLLDLSPLPAYQRCIELVPHLVWLGSTINQRYSLLANISDLAAEAAAWAISVQAHDLAIEWLEQGRSIVWSQILHLRTPFDDLDTVDHALAQRLRSIASQLEGAATRPLATSLSKNTLPDLENDAQHHRRLAGEWERLLQQARDIDGFDNFMRPRRAKELKLAATNGPIILINTHSTRWDALIIFPERDDIAHVPLNTPSEGTLAGETLALQFSTYSARHRSERVGGFGRVQQRPNPESPLKAGLAALWVVVVKPILDALAGMRKLPLTELPHVTWCATGPLAFAPLHAAGPYDGSCPSAFDLVISSYTPTLSALLASSVPAPDSNAGMLAVGQEFTGNFPPLPSTVPELEAIKRHAKAMQFLQLDGKNASVDAVLCAMEEHSWVHLACHATQNPVNPAHSAFHLSDGNLTLETIMKRHFKNKGLAFLSACQTATGDGKLPDEAVHLAAGMLMAGYPSVIATMWSIWDVDGPEVAERVYAGLLGGGRITRGGTARALHRAVGELRQKVGEGSFERWVPFIHIGL